MDGSELGSSTEGWVSMEEGAGVQGANVCRLGKEHGHSLAS